MHAGGREPRVPRARDNAGRQLVGVPQQSQRARSPLTPQGSLRRRRLHVRTGRHRQLPVPRLYRQPHQSQVTTSADIRKVARTRLPSVGFRS